MTRRADTFRTSPKHNPFSTRYVRPGAVEYLFFDGQSGADLVVRLQELEWRAQIVGPHGSGKSTLLHWLVPRIERAGRIVRFFELHDGQSKLPFDRSQTMGNGGNSVFIIDGYEQLGWRARSNANSWCVRDNVGLLVTSHESVGLPTLFQTSVSLETAKSVVNEILPDKAPEISAKDVAALHELHAGNMREVLFGLYDLYERRCRGGD